MNHFSCRCWRRTIMQTIVWLACTGAARAQGEAARLELAERWSNVESGKEITIHVRVLASERVVGRLSWAFSAGAATVARGEANVDVAAGQSKGVAVKIPGPTVRPGVIVEAAFAAAVVREKENHPAAKLRRTFWILPEDPFADRREWAKDLKAVVYDPKGATTQVLKKAEFPFEEERNLAALDEVKAGLVILGEGLSWRDEAGLGDVAWKLAERGVRVLCLAPSEGPFAFPGLGKKASKTVSQLTLRKADVITGWDKRLDADNWHGDFASVTSGIALRADGEDVVGEAAADGVWPWVDVRFGASGGALAFCGFGVIRHWEAGPTPRFVFLRALEAVTDKK
jgi:hypothetical protein